jgi:DNA-binding SARP family transcriptional activator
VLEVVEGDALEFRILGPLEVVADGQPLALGGQRQRALLALLLLRANEVVAADVLIDAVWGDEPPRDATNALQYHVSQLRKAIGSRETVLTQEPGYLIRVAPNELDLFAFEQLVDDAQTAVPEDAARLLRSALELWRGPPLGDCAYADWAQMEIVRLEELRVRALELRIDADLALGRHAQLVGELETLVREHPLRERPRAALMRALYASGRQAEALEAYREARALLVDELGIEPSRELQELERAILRHDSSLAVSPEVQRSPRAIVVVVREEASLTALRAIAEPLARRPERELILARLVLTGDDLARATALLAEQREGIVDGGLACRVAAYTSLEPGGDAARLATEHDADLVLVDARPDPGTGALDHELTVVLAGAPCDVAVLAGGAMPESGPVVTPFGGIDHDWSAIELAALLAKALDTSLRLLGTEADPSGARRDASRLLARASLLVQQVVGIVTEPMLVPAGEQGVVDAASDARLLVVGLSERWPAEGIGPVRAAVAAAAAAPILFVRRGVRANGLGPPQTLTRFSWTVAAG